MTAKICSFRWCCFCDLFHVTAKKGGLTIGSMVVSLWVHSFKVEPGEKVFYIFWPRIPLFCISQKLVILWVFGVGQSSWYLGTRTPRETFVFLVFNVGPGLQTYLETRVWGWANAWRRLRKTCVFLMRRDGWHGSVRTRTRSFLNVSTVKSE